MNEVTFAIITSIAATIIWTIWVTFVKKVKNTKRISYKNSIKRIKEAGVITFFYNRESLTKDVGTIGAYIKKANRDITYIGCWLSGALNAQDAVEAIVKQCTNGVECKFCILSPNSPLIDYYSNFFDITPSDLKEKTTSTIAKLYRIKSNLPDTKKHKLKIYIHDEFVNTSFWIIDPGLENSIIQMDHKLFGRSRLFSYGFEIINKPENDFYENIQDSYFKLLAKSNELTNAELENLTKSKMTV
jgi:hypothetical protein